MQIDTRELVERLGLYGCIQCGKCAGGCPVSMKTTLDVRFLIYEALTGYLPDPAHMEELWDCTCCFTCVERCPKDVKPAEFIIGLRSLLVESGMIPKTVTDALQGISARATRSALRASSARTGPRDSTSSPRKKAARRSILSAAHLRMTFASNPSPKPSPGRCSKPGSILASWARTRPAAATKCAAWANRACSRCWSKKASRSSKAPTPAHGDNLAALHEHVQKEYGLNMEVVHYSQVMADLLDKGKIKFSGKVEKRVTYHDRASWASRITSLTSRVRSSRQSRASSLWKWTESASGACAAKAAAGACGSKGRTWKSGSLSSVCKKPPRLAQRFWPWPVLLPADARRRGQGQGLEDKLRVMDIMELVNMAL